MMTRNEQTMAQWLLDLDEYEFLVVDTTNTDYAYVGSAVGVLRKKAHRRGWRIYAEELGPRQAVVQLMERADD